MGGSAGGGKSDALLTEALRQVHIKHYRALILRKTYPQLSELIDRSRDIYTPAFPKARYNESKHYWQFPSGAKIYFGAMQHTKDRTNYQGKRYDFIGFDELTHFTYEEYSYMFSRNRPSGTGTRVYMRATTNPGGIGHGWVKDRFITPAPAGTKIPTTYTVTTPKGEVIQLQRERIFIPSTVFDNQELLRNDPMYLANLAMLPEAERNALLYGDWNSFDGQVFREWKNDKEHYKDHRWTHVIEPFKIPTHWKIYRGFDFGYAKPFSVGWYAVDEDGRIYRIKEYYGCTNTPNTGIKINPFEIAKNIRELENEDENLKGRNIIGIADPSIFDESRGESVARMMEKHPNYIYWSGGDNTRIAGKMQFHYRLAFDEEGLPMFQVFNTCKHFIRTLPTLVYDDKKVEDINTEQEDHIYDECLVGETLVITEFGKKPIKELVDTNGKVYSSDGKLHNYSDCRMTKKNVDVYEVELEDGTKIRATANHPFMLEDGTFIELKDLEIGYKLKNINNKNITVFDKYYMGKADVYNMEVEDTHDYAVENGTIVHNCRYVLMENPITARQNHAEVREIIHDPLDLKAKKNDKYKFFKM